MKTTYETAENRQTLTPTQTRSTVVGYGLSIGMTTALFIAIPFANMLSVREEEEIEEIRDPVELMPPLPPPIDPPEPPEVNDEVPKPTLKRPPEFIDLIPLDNPWKGGPTGVLHGNPFEIIDPDVTSMIFDPDQLDKQPVVIQRIAPEYSYEAKSHGIEGWVEIEFVVDEQGQVRNARVKRSSHRIFEASVLDAILMWRFEPGIKNKAPVRTRMLAPFRFTLGR